MDFKIETGVPVPTPKPPPGWGRSQALRELLKAPSGSSIFFPGTKLVNVANLSREVGGSRETLTFRTVDGGVRAWRK